MFDDEFCHYNDTLNRREAKKKIVRAYSGNSFFVGIFQEGTVKSLHFSNISLNRQKKCSKNKKTDFIMTISGEI
jgi:hypothetical protein